jgi:predicted metal-dependent TIM-barrel fold hydrolase
VANSGIVELASKRDFPILIHCSKRNDEGDFLDNLINFTEQREINLCIAHVGLLH